MRFALHDCAARDDPSSDEDSCKESVDNGAFFVGGSFLRDLGAFAPRAHRAAHGRTPDAVPFCFVWCSVKAPFWRLVRCVAPESSARRFLLFWLQPRPHMPSSVLTTMQATMQPRQTQDRALFARQDVSFRVPNSRDQTHPRHPLPSASGHEMFVVTHQASRGRDEPTLLHHPT